MSFDVDQQEELEQPLLSPLQNQRMTSPEPKLNGTLMALTFLSAIGGFLFGYDTGVVSGAMLLIEDDPDINPTTVWKELIVSSTVSFLKQFILDR